MKKQILIVILLLIVFLIISCSGMPYFMYVEQIYDQTGNEDDMKIENQLSIISFLENIIDTEEYLAIEVFGRKTFSPLIRQTKLLTHSFYLINLSNGRHYTLSFTGGDFKLYSDGFWVLNKETDLLSYKLFIEGNNVWDLGNLYTENVIDTRQTLKNIIGLINIGANYYFLDHLRSRQNSLNCNTAIIETIALNQ